MARAKLKPGTKIEFVHRHRHKTGDEILELAKAEKIPLTRNRLTTIRWQLREQYGVTDSGSTPLKAKYKAKGVSLVPQQRHPLSLRTGTKIEFVSRHLNLTNQEIIKAAKAEKIKISPATLDSMRWTLKNKHGFGEGDTGGKTKKKKEKKEETNGMSPKAAQLRKLVFEMGYDAVREIFLEFQEMHNRWS